MKVSLDIDSKHKETHVTIQCNEMDDTIKEILDFLKGKETEFIVGRNGDMQHILRPNDVHYIYSREDIVFAVTSKGEFKLKQKLFELEEMLPSKQFIRISKSVIANLYELSRFEASFNGTLCVYFKSGVKEYVSRHYVRQIKESLKMNRRIKK
ncbi:LytTR family DNA-binding domain-containing protein [Virgibacillus oceani]|uniref:Transcriptional regulator n=1 Tax=Virgibacillus oceani TaxID=1479511 RepID=A0A917HJH9_9BACI|nr:LytTR family DNA-binding domain-containing protein [Virgibacillus oceani]GGG80574.1 transcriptional regulator [Virgibacillus oceani]